MRKIIKITLLILICCYTTLAQVPNNYVEKELIIWLEPNVKPYEFAANHPQVISPKRVLSRRLNIWLFEYTGESGQRIQDMTALKSSIEVIHVQNNHYVESRATTPNDSHYDQQWAPDVINLPEAWDYSTGGTSVLGDEVVIAVIDGGFDLDHEDLRFWKNNGELPDNGIDDDNNGYVDDFDGWNAYDHSGSIPSDNHGTHVAGIAGAIGNNGTGVSGVNWNVGIMPVAGSSGDEATVVEAYSYVLEMRALYNETNGQEGAFIVVTNASFGVDQGDPDDFPIWCSLYDELGNVGILNCAATANRNWNIDEVGDVPTACASNFLIAVTNTDINDNKVTNAGYGINTIDVGAPGQNIFSTLPNDNYGNLSGTSMATPQVTGVIALMYAAAHEGLMQTYRNDPAMIALLMRDFLFEGAEHLTSLDGLVAHGRIDAFQAVLLTQDLECADNLTITDPITSGTTITYDADISITATNTVHSGANATYQAGTEILLGLDFEALPGSEFRAYIGDGCTSARVGNSAGTYANVKTVYKQESSPSGEVLATDGLEPVVSVFPNPFDRQTTIQYQVAEADTPVRIVVYDLKGAVVSDLVSEENHPSGTHQVVFERGQLPPGLYVCNVRIGNHTESVKLLLED